MRILASNPDTIGDMVLRQPMYRALLDAGHELTLIVRPAVAPLVPHVLPGIRLLELPDEVYRPDLANRWDRFSALFEEVRQVDPQLLVIAPYRWTLFEEKLVEALPGVTSVGMNGNLYAGDPYFGFGPQSRVKFDRVAKVTREMPEVEKNAAIARAVLDRPVEFVWPRLELNENLKARGEKLLRDLDLQPGEFWVACVTGTANVKIKVWQSEKWSALLARWARERGRQFLFCGIEDEESQVREIQERMGDAARFTQRCILARERIDDLLAVMGMSCGYVGHDTGPMHIAAAFQKRVLGVFGGGTFPRFLPAVEPSVALTLDLACAGCGWACSFSSAHCVGDVELDDVFQAAMDLEDGKVRGQEIRKAQPTSAQLQQMIRDGAELSQRRVREGGEFRLQLVESQRQASAIGEHLQQLGTALNAKQNELNTANQQIGVLNAELAAKAQERASLCKEIIRLQDELRDAQPKPRHRRSLKDRWIQWYVGEREYKPRRRLPPMPILSLVMSVEGFDDAAVRTIDSVLEQKSVNLQLIVAHSAGEKVPAKYEQEIDLIEWPAGENVTAGLAKSLAETRGDLVAVLHPGDELERAAVAHILQLFRTRKRLNVVAFDDVLDGDGARKPANPTAMDVISMLQRGYSRSPWVIFRRWIYPAMGGLKKHLGAAAEWEWQLRLARQFRIQREQSHLRRIPASPKNAQLDSQFAQAEDEFVKNFGPIGRARCQAIYLRNRLLNRLCSRSEFHFASARTSTGKRLLFTASDAENRGAGTYHLYHDLAADRVLIDRVHDGPTAYDLNGPDAADKSKLAAKRDGAVKVWLSMIPSQISDRDSHVRCLLVGAEDLATIQRLRTLTAWKIDVITTDADVLGGVEDDGVEIWNSSPENASLKIPSDRQFDLIFLGDLVSRADDPASLLRRIRLLLKPRGRIFVSLPNLHSRELRGLGSNWEGWQPSQHRTIVGPTGLGVIAEMCDLRVDRWQSRSNSAAGFSRLLSDWRGQGDRLYAILQNR